MTQSVRCILQISSLRCVILRTLTISSHCATDRNDDNKRTSKSVSELMTALKSLKVDGVTSDTKKKIGLSAATEFKERKLEKLPSPKNAAVGKKEECKGELDEVEELVKDAAVDVSELMTALKSIKVEGVTSDTKKIIGFSAAAEFTKRKLEKLQRESPKNAAIENKEEFISKGGLDEVEELVKEAAGDVAKAFPDQKKTESELLQQLMRFKEATAAGESGQAINDVSAILRGIKVQKEGEGKERVFSARGDHQSPNAFDRAFADVAGSISRDNQMDQDAHPYQRQRKTTLFDQQRLNIFQPEKDEDKKVSADDITVQKEPSIWDIEAEKMKKELLAASIGNGFDEMIQLTEEGKLWTYPIDNERGLEEEQKIPFHEHIFLDQHLEGFPNIAEVLNFMELVLIGLGKNPYLTVQQKREHIEWFRQYFEQKADILNNIAVAS